MHQSSKCNFSKQRSSHCWTRNLYATFQKCMFGSLIDLVNLDLVIAEVVSLFGHLAVAQAEEVGLHLYTVLHPDRNGDFLSGHGHCNRTNR